MLDFCGRGVCCGFFSGPHGPHFPEDWDHGDHDDGDDHEFVILLYKFEVAEVIAHQCEHGDPEDAADDIVEQKEFVVHLADARDEGGEGADDRDEAGEDDRFAAVFVVELLRTIEIFLFDKGNFRSNFGCPESVSNPVIDGVTDNSSNGK